MVTTWEQWLAGYEIGGLITALSRHLCSGVYGDRPLWEFVCKEGDSERRGFLASWSALSSLSFEVSLVSVRHSCIFTITDAGRGQMPRNPGCVYIATI